MSQGLWFGMFMSVSSASGYAAVPAYDLVDELNRLLAVRAESCQRSHSGSDDNVLGRLDTYPPYFQVDPYSGRLIVRHTRFLSELALNGVQDVPHVDEYRENTKTEYLETHLTQVQIHFLADKHTIALQCMHGSHCMTTVSWDDHNDVRRKGQSNHFQFQYRNSITGGHPTTHVVQQYAICWQPGFNSEESDELLNKAVQQFSTRMSSILFY